MRESPVSYKKSCQVDKDEHDKLEHNLEFTTKSKNTSKGAQKLFPWKIGEKILFNHSTFVCEKQSPMISVIIY